MKWALVLSGGGALGLAHLGVIKVLERENLKPSMIVGTSMGAIVGGLWAFGYNSEEMEQLVRDFNISDFLEGITFKLPFDNFVTKFLQAEEAFGNLMGKRGVMDGLKTRAYLNNLFQNKTFQDTKIPFYCNAADILKGHEMILHDGSLSDGIYASMAYPGFFAPLERAEELLCDGAVLNNYPVWIARQFGRRRVIGVDVGHYSRIPSANLENGISVILRSFTTACQARRRTRKDRASLTLHIAALQATSFDFEDSSKLIKAGEEIAEKYLKSIKRAIHTPIRLRRTIKK